MVTLPLERMASRVAASLCYATGLGREMVVSSQQEYEVGACPAHIIRPARSLAFSACMPVVACLGMAGSAWLLHRPRFGWKGRGAVHSWLRLCPASLLLAAAQLSVILLA